MKEFGKALLMILGVVSLGWLALAAIGVVRLPWCATCCEECEKPPPEGPLVVGLEDGCPDDWDAVTIINDMKRVNVGTELGKAERELGHAGGGKTAQHNIPEYHDCQRFLTGSAAPGQPFGDLFAVFALAPDSLVEHLDENDGLPVLAAQIWSLDGVYAELDIEPWFNCLYMWQSSGQWQAHVRWSGIDASGCSAKLKDLPDPTLSVVYTQPSTNMEDYPLAARWEWDPATSAYRIGIQCGVGWCEVTGDRNEPGSLESAWDRQQNAGSTIADPTNGAWSGALRARAEVKGWYDDQVLDIVEEGELVSSGIRGYAFPNPEIAAAREALYQGNWVLSAFVYLDLLYDESQVAKGLDKYLTEYGFGQTRWDQPNEVWFCDPGTSGCEGADEKWRECLGSVGADTWLGRVHTAGTPREQYQYLCVARCDHSPAYVPGTARWRGVEDDAKMWTRCAEGCCTIQ